VDERCNSPAIRQQSLSVKLRKNSIADTEAIRPDQLIIFLDQPTVGYVAAGNLLAVGGPAEDKPLEGKQFRPGRTLDLRFPVETCAIKEDCLLGQPSELRALEHSESGRDSRGLVQRAIDLFGRLRRHPDGS